MSFVRLSSDHQPRTREVFLDTSIHCCRLKGPDFLGRIEDVLRRFRWKGTSTYCKVEFGNVVLAQAEYYLRKLKETGSLQRVLDFIGNVLPHSLHRAKVTWSFNLLSQVCGSDEEERTERARLSLNRLMKLGVAFVEDFCDKPLADGTECDYARKGVTKDSQGQLKWRPPRCKRNHRQCKLDEFFTKHRGDFVQIRDAILALPSEKLTDQLKGFVEVVDRALQDPRVLLDYRDGCKRLADAIIAVDSMGYGCMFSQNVKESEVLTGVLRQDFYYLPPNTARGVEVIMHSEGS